MTLTQILTLISILSWYIYWRRDVDDEHVTGTGKQMPLPGNGRTDVESLIVIVDDDVIGDVILSGGLGYDDRRAVYWVT